MSLLIAIASVLIGFYAREILVALKSILAVTERLRASQNETKTQSTPTNNFVEPMTRAEVVALMEQERVEAMNQR